VDAVLVGWYRQVTMDALESACEAVWGGAAFYSCSQSRFFASAEGRVMGTSRAISAMVRSLTGCRVQVVGKPSLHALRSAAGRLGARPEDLVVVGDSVWDMQAAARVGAAAIGVATGGTSAPELHEAGAELTFQNLTALLEALQVARPESTFRA
jgi:NagD protein